MNKKYLLALNRIPQISPRTIREIAVRWPDLEELFRESLASLEKAGMPFPLAKFITEFNWDSIAADLKWEEQTNRAILTWDDAMYPALLKEIDDPPPVLYAKGNVTCLEQIKLSIVGSRKPSAHGEEIAWQFSRDIARSRVAIVSGLAIGIDGHAHAGCLAAKGQTIAVMGTGIDCLYPKQHCALAEKIIENGLLLSEFPLRTPPNARHFPRRNRIISGLSMITLVVEAAIKSGSLITARLALEQNRDVLAIPGSIHNPQARGCHYLVQQGAKLVTSSREILEELNSLSKAPPFFFPSPQACGEGAQRADEGELHRSASPKTAPMRLDAQRENNNHTQRPSHASKNLVKFIGFETTTVDEMISRSGLQMEKIVCELIDLEILGIVKSVPGGYMRCR